jgi:hypothetical protein
MYCSLTGDYPCQCPPSDKYRSAIGQALKVDLRASIRKVFSEHANYTHFLIIESLPMLQPNAEVVTNRLLRNPTDIAQRIEPLVGPDKADLIEQLFTDHLKLAASALTPLRDNLPDELDEAVEKFYAQGDILAEGLYLLNPDFLNLDKVKELIHEHNEFVVKLASLRQATQYEDYIETYDEYTKHMMMIAEVLHQALTN